MYHIRPGDNTNILQLNKERIQYTNRKPGLYGDDPFTVVRLPQRDLSSQSFGK